MSWKTNRQLVDPIGALVEKTGNRRNLRPASLVAVRLDVEIRGGLVITEVTRTYHNASGGPIEALLSFPSPVSAYCYELSARIGDRTLRGIARAKAAAREEYEDAIDSGKTTVLYEELLPGIHMLSVGNLAEGETADVTMRWADSIRVEASRARYRIPMTLGEVYGQSGLLETDELVTGGSPLEAELVLKHDARAVMLNEAALELGKDGKLRGTVSTDAPVDILIDGWKPGLLQGCSQTGRAVLLDFSPWGHGADGLDVAILVDISGSMASRNEGRGRSRRSKHAAVKSALRSAASLIRPWDRFSLWTFNHECQEAGRSAPETWGYPPGSNVGSLAIFAMQLARPSGGTEIGEALKASKAGEHRDVLLITDGLSYALDPLEHARSGRRVSVVLVGEDSLDARVGHLAALTGGDVYYSFDGDVRRALAQAIRRLRRPWQRPEAAALGEDGLPRAIRVVRGGAIIEASWGETADRPKAGSVRQAVAAFAAGMALSSAESEEAAQLVAMSEGLVSSFTSLVLVDHDRAVQDRQLQLEKLTLPTPRTGTAQAWPAMAARSISLGPVGRNQKGEDERVIKGEPPRPPSPRYPEVRRWLAAIGRMVNWTEFRRALGAGMLAELPLPFATMIRALAHILAKQSAAKRLAEEHGLDETRLAIALVATVATDRSAAARRVWEELLPQGAQEDFNRLAEEFGRLTRLQIDASLWGWGSDRAIDLQPGPWRPEHRRA